MTGKINFLVCIVILTFLALSSSGLLIPDKLDGKTKLTLTFLGTLNGTSYFADPNITVNWTDAQAYCNESGLKLTSIVNREQSDLMRKALREKYGDKNKHFWTAGRNSVRISGFVWDGVDDLKPIEQVFDGFMTEPGITTCTTVQINENERFELHGHACSQAHSVLCQT